MINRFVLLSLLILLNASCANNDVTKQNSYVGTWTVTQVMHDGTPKNEWIGTHLSISQTKTNGGVYSMSDTKYDSIWRSTGSWTASTETAKLILDDTLTVVFSVDADKLYISKRLPWTVTTKSLPDVTGYWDFTFSRKK